MTSFFGQRWDAPRVDHATQVPTPVGENCLYCEESIEDGDRGLLTPYVLDIIDGHAVGGVAPTHMECDLRMGTGDVEHLEGGCTCRSRQARHLVAVPDPAAKTYRQEAREVLAWINTLRARDGMGPM